MWERRSVANVRMEISFLGEKVKLATGCHETQCYPLLSHVNPNLWWITFIQVCNFLQQFAEADNCVAHYLITLIIRLKLLFENYMLFMLQNKAIIKSVPLFMMIRWYDSSIKQDSIEIEFGKYLRKSHSSFKFSLYYELTSI